MKTLSLVSSILLIWLLAIPLKSQNSGTDKSKSAAEIIAEIINKTGAATIAKTVDVIKEGDPETPVKGIITTMFATMDVLKEAVKKNCNLIIVHEPLYYNHLDETTLFKDDPVFLEKQRYITEHKLVIWRFHDYIHRMKPDGIEAGVVEKLGWKKNSVNGSTDQFVLPQTTLKELLKYLKNIFPENSFYVVGNPEMKLSKVRLAVGAPGSRAHINLLEDNNVEVLLAGESPQWETYEYMRDAVSQGRNKAIIFLGHIASEEAGMEYCSQWLKSFIIDIPIYFIQSGPSYWSY